MTSTAPGPPPDPALVRRLRAAGCVYAEDEAALLGAAAAGDAGTLADLVARRTAGEPLEQVLGWAGLAGVRIALDPGVFAPRRRSELLVREAAAAAGTGALLVDLCCGSGAVGAAVAAARPDLAVHAADLDPAAAACARRNLPPDRVHLGDLYAALPPALRGRVGVLAVHAPYVPTGELGLLPPEARLHEPQRALDGGPDGLAVQRRVTAGAAEWLTPGGVLLLETGARLAAAGVALLRAGGLAVRVAVDDGLGATVLIGRKG